MNYTRSKKDLSSTWRIYAIIDGGVIRCRYDLPELAQKISMTEVDVVQFRFDEPDYIAHFSSMQESINILRGAGKPVLVNDRIEFALALGADGVHLGSADIPVALARKILGKGFLIGKTVRTKEEADRAAFEKVDYLSVGPCFATPVKPGLNTVSSRTVKEIAVRTRLPIYAIGGINARNAPLVMSLGVDGVVAARYLTEGDIAKRAGCLFLALTKGKGK